jgi:hypothetical protein
MIAVAAVWCVTEHTVTIVAATMRVDKRRKGRGMIPKEMERVEGGRYLFRLKSSLRHEAKSFFLRGNDMINDGQGEDGVSLMFVCVWE